jgi:hypothetical protein
VISSYLVANEETARCGIILSFASELILEAARLHRAFLDFGLGQRHVLEPDRHSGPGRIVRRRRGPCDGPAGAPYSRVSSPHLVRVFHVRDLRARAMTVVAHRAR